MPTDDTTPVRDFDETDFAQKHLLNLVLLAISALLTLVSAAISSLITGEGVARTWFTPGATITGWALLPLIFAVTTLYSALYLAHGFRTLRKQADQNEPQPGQEPR